MEFFVNRFVSLTNHHFLHFHIVAVDEAEHVNASGGLEVQAVAAFNLLVAHDVAGDVNNLQGGLAVVVDNPVAVVLEDEVVVGTIVSGKHQLKAVGGICRQGVEGVARDHEQVNILTRLVVDEVQIVEVDLFGAK